MNRIYFEVHHRQYGASRNNVPVTFWISRDLPVKQGLTCFNRFTIITSTWLCNWLDMNWIKVTLSALRWTELRRFLTGISLHIQSGRPVMLSWAFRWARTQSINNSCWRSITLSPSVSHPNRPVWSTHPNVNKTYNRKWNVSDVTVLIYRRGIEADFVFVGYLQVITHNYTPIRDIMLSDWSNVSRQTHTVYKLQGLTEYYIYILWFAKTSLLLKDWKCLKTTFHDQRNL